MIVFHLKYQNIFILLGLIFLVYLSYHFSFYVVTTRWYDHWFGDDSIGECTKHHRWTLPKEGLPLIGLLGPPGSGVEWVRYLIEQMTGVYTGSVHSDFPEYFKGEDKTHSVVAVMSYDVERLPKMHAGILVYRSMKDTVRTTYAQNAAPDTLLEAPLETYYGPDWPRFARYESAAWTERYQNYLQAGRPVMIVNYDQLSDPTQCKAQLLKIANFLRLPVRHSRINCLVERGADHPLKPRVLRHTFQPFSLLAVNDSARLERMENLTEALIGKASDSYSPKLH